MDNELIKQRLSELNPDYAPFVKGNFAIDVAKIMGKTEEFTDEQIAILANGISLFLLVFFSTEKLISFIETECEVTPTKAREISGFVLASLPDGFLDLINQAYGEFVNTKPEDFTNGGTDKTNSPIVPSINSNQEPTYSTTQEAILKEGGSNGSPPRWGNQT